MKVIGGHILPFSLLRQLEWNENELGVVFRPSTRPTRLNNLLYVKRENMNKVIKYLSLFLVIILLGLFIFYKFSSPVETTQ
jgi:hypothetical protein